MISATLRWISRGFQSEGESMVNRDRSMLQHSSGCRVAFQRSTRSLSGQRQFTLRSKAHLSGATMLERIVASCFTVSTVVTHVRLGSSAAAGLSDGAKETFEHFLSRPQIRSRHRPCKGPLPALLRRIKTTRGCGGGARSVSNPFLPDARLVYVLWTVWWFSRLSARLAM
jgi:hypothetical protein